jgi:hypothetical protein
MSAVTEGGFHSTFSCSFWDNGYGEHNRFYLCWSQHRRSLFLFYPQGHLHTLLVIEGTKQEEEPH